MAKCIECGGYTKYHNGYCYSCYPKKGSKKNKETQTTTKKTKFPTHTELFRDLHLIEDELIRYIYKFLNWKFETEKTFFKSAKKTEYSVLIEVEGWDIAYIIKKTPENRVYEYIDVDLVKTPFLCIEYKSSINEWGKQIDSFFRQIKKRMNRFSGAVNILLSFDERFNEYFEACMRANILLIVIPLEKINSWKEKGREMNKNIA